MLNQRNNSETNKRETYLDSWRCQRCGADKKSEVELVQLLEHQDPSKFVLLTWLVVSRNTNTLDLSLLYLRQRHSTSQTDLVPSRTRNPNTNSPSEYLCYIRLTKILLPLEPPVQQRRWRQRPSWLLGRGENRDPSFSVFLFFLLLFLLGILFVFKSKNDFVVCGVINVTVVCVVGSLNQHLYILLTLTILI